MGNARAAAAALRERNEENDYWHCGHGGYRRYCDNGGVYAGKQISVAVEIIVPFCAKWA